MSFIPRLPQDVGSVNKKFQPVTYGTGSGFTVLPGATLGNDANPGNRYSTEFSTNPAAFPNGNGGSYSILPLAVQRVDPTAVPNTPAVPAGNTGSSSQVTGSGNVPPATAVSATGSFSLTGWLLSMITNPGQHIIGVIVLALVGWWLYKHVIKKI